MLIGFYFINVNAKKNGVNFLYVRVEVGRNEVLHMTDINMGNPGNILSNSVVTQCTAGNMISVISVIDEMYVYGEPGIAHSTFTVLLMIEAGTVIYCIIFVSIF